MEETQFAIRHESDAQGIAIPACALAQQAYAIGRAVGLRPGFWHETDHITEATQPQAELEILPGADIEPALSQEYIAAIHGTRAR
jgi:hypothetical protein